MSSCSLLIEHTRRLQLLGRSIHPKGPFLAHMTMAFVVRLPQILHASDISLQLCCTRARPHHENWRLWDEPACSGPCACGWTARWPRKVPHCRFASHALICSHLNTVQACVGR